MPGFVSYLKHSPHPRKMGEHSRKTSLMLNSVGPILKTWRCWLIPVWLIQCNGEEDCPVMPVKTVGILRGGLSNHMILNTNPTHSLLR